MAQLSETALIEKVLEIHHRLCVAYQCPVAYFHSLDPLSELVSSLLSHRTRNADLGRAFKALRAAYPDWAAVRDAPTADIQQTISGVTWPEQKAPRIQQILRGITERRGGELSLDFLADMEVTEARAWLETLSGRGSEDQRRRPQLQHAAASGPAGGQPPPPRRRQDRHDPGDPGGRPGACGALGAVAATTGTPSGSMTTTKS